MGWNYYTTKNTGWKHTGKAWACGIWCHKCKIEAERDVVGCFWYCPKCGQRVSQKTLHHTKHLQKHRDKNPEGVDYACGFIWCIGEYGLAKTVSGIKRILRKKHRWVIGETKRMSVNKFLDRCKGYVRYDTEDADFC